MSLQPASPWFVRAREKPDAELRLLCFPHAGGAASAYHRWASQLSAEVVAVQLPGREGRLREPPMLDLLAVARAVADAMQGDPLWQEPPSSCVFFGHSMGALLAYETARELQRRGRALPLALLVSGRAPPDHVPDESLLHPLPDADFIDELDRRFGGLPAILREEPELMALFLPVLRADVTMLERHHYVRADPLPLPIAAFGGLADQRARREHLQAWSSFGKEWRGLQQFAGGHFYLHEAGSGLLPALAAELGVLAGGAVEAGSLP